MEIEFICLANSRKNTEHCVAGIRTDTGAWVRPVSSERGGALDSQQCATQEGPAKLLQIIRAELDPQPEPSQPENWLISERRWTLVKSLDAPAALEYLRPYITKGPELFGNTDDKVMYSPTSVMDSSLALIEPVNLRWEIKWRPWNGRPQRPQKQALFEIAGQEYNLVVTDPELENELHGLSVGTYLAEADGYPASANRYLTISLAGAFDDGSGEHCYKLVAGLIAS